MVCLGAVIRFFAAECFDGCAEDVDNTIYECLGSMVHETLGAYLCFLSTMSISLLAAVQCTVDPVAYYVVAILPSVLVSCYYASQVVRFWLPVAFTLLTVGVAVAVRESIILGLVGCILLSIVVTLGFHFYYWLYQGPQSAHTACLYIGVCISNLCTDHDEDDSTDRLPTTPLTLLAFWWWQSWLCLLAVAVNHYVAGLVLLVVLSLPFAVGIMTQCGERKGLWPVVIAVLLTGGTVGLYTGVMPHPDDVRRVGRAEAGLAGGEAVFACNTSLSNDSASYLVLPKPLLVDIANLTTIEVGGVQIEVAPLRGACLLANETLLAGCIAGSMSCPLARTLAPSGVVTHMRRLSRSEGLNSSQAAAVEELAEGVFEVNGMTYDEMEKWMSEEVERLRKQWCWAVGGWAAMSLVLVMGPAVVSARMQGRVTRYAIDVHHEQAASLMPAPQPPWPTSPPPPPSPPPSPPPVPPTPPISEFAASSPGLVPETPVPLPSHPGPQCSPSEAPVHDQVPEWPPLSEYPTPLAPRPPLPGQHGNWWAGPVPEEPPVYPQQPFRPRAPPCRGGISRTTSI